MKVLTKLLDGSPLNQFLDQHFTRMPFSHPATAQSFSHLLNWDMVQQVLQQKNSVLRIVQDGKVIKDYVEMEFAEARQHHQQGHTLLVRYAEKSHPLLKDLAQDFATAFHTEVDIQLYCTPAGHNAFGWHYDVEEVFIIQTQGSKEYTIRPNTVHPLPLVSSIPKDLGYEREKTPVEIKVTLEAGDWLYIPSGWWHIAKTQSESMHISVGLMPISAIDIVNFLSPYLSSQLFWRTRMPIYQEFLSDAEEVSFYQEALGKLGRELGVKMQDPAFIKAFLAHKKNKKTN